MAALGKEADPEEVVELPGGWKMKRTELILLRQVAEEIIKQSRT